MRILVVGGTRFVGRHLVAAAVARGHQVTVLHRGVGCTAPPGTEHLHADRDADLAALAGRSWDATVDTCAYLPRQVSALADALEDRGGRYVLISTVSVYADAHEPGLDEQAPVVPPLGLDGEAPAIDDHTYGRLKVGCEQVAAQRFAGALLVVRPTYIVGPHDHTARFPYWVARMARGGEVLCPGDPGAPMQVVDGRDLAVFTVGLLEAGSQGVYHALGPEPPWSFADLLAGIQRAVAPPGTTLTWVPSAWLAEQGVDPGALPLWTGSDEPEFALAMDPAAALAAGLRLRPVGQTAQDTLAWLDSPDGARLARRAWLPADREEALLNAWRDRAG
ncbi:MAG: NAD-dependent epimerase/dehydratase family protein [Candidatus Nanopelagicales bacterium]|jgi:2'-hydroxyisoflavone reductase|nr:NAD-dependent epimerase/dehydratase family protein [Candidatus Nanopelagicales bacterium]